MKRKVELLLQHKEKTVPILSYPSTQLLGISVKELIASSNMQAKGMKAIAERCDVGASLNMMDLSVEAEAFGSRIRIYEDEIPFPKAITRTQNTTLIVMLIDEKTGEGSIPRAAARRILFALEANPPKWARNRFCAAEQVCLSKTIKLGTGRF